MDILKGKDMIGGWFVGDFEPSAYNPQGEIWDNHYHKIATEINYLIRGKMNLSGTTLEEGDIFILQPGEIAIPEFLTDCELVVVKTPSIKGDKYII